MTITQYRKYLKQKTGLKDRHLGKIPWVAKDLHESQIKIGWHNLEKVTLSHFSNKTITLGYGYSWKELVAVLAHELCHFKNPMGVPVGELKKYGEDFFIAFKLIGEYEAYRLEGEVLKYLGVVGHIKTENSPTDLVNFAITRLGDSRNYKDFYRKSIRASAEKLKTMKEDMWVI